MKQGPLPWLYSLGLSLTVAALAIGVSGCKRSDPRGDGARITGKPSDPPVTFVPRWDETNAFVYHLETITGTQVPRRNSDVVIQQDTVLAKDLRFEISGVTGQGVRSLNMEIQAVRVETTADQRLTSAFDTENELLSTEDNTVASRLRRVKGAKLGFKVSPEGRVIRVDASKDFNDRIGSGRSVRGAAGAVLNKFFNQQFYRDMVEMSFLPTGAVRIGDSWTIQARSIAGLYNNSGVELTYTFRGWQVHEGTNCARFDFVGNTPNPGAPANSSGSTNANRRPSNSSNEGIEIEGTVWFCQDLGVPVEMEYTQSITRQSTSTRTVRVPGTNGGPAMVVSRSAPGGSGGAPVVQPLAVVEVEDEIDVAPSTNAPAPANAPSTAVRTATPVPAPAATTSTTTTSRKTVTKQHVVLTLVELVPVEFPPAKPTSSSPSPVTPTTPVAAPVPSPNQTAPTPAVSPTSSTPSEAARPAPAAAPVNPTPVPAPGTSIPGQEW